MSVIVNSVISLSAMGFVFASGLAIASKKFAVDVDPRQEAILDVLPGANCGGCGFPGCGGLATAIVEGKAPVNGCPVEMLMYIVMVQMIMQYKKQSTLVYWIVKLP